MTTVSRSVGPGGGRHKVLMAAAIAVFAVLLTLKYFPGLENEPNYAGLAYQTIHPEAFSGDVYRDPDIPLRARPLQLSLVYALVKVVGDLWLDDRFLAVLYIGLVAAGLAGIDRTARLLGVSATLERLFILLVFLKDHAVLDHKLLLAHHQGFNHTAFAIPIIVWLFYAALARKGLPVILGLSVLLLAFSIRNAPIPIISAMAVVAVTGSRRERVILAGLGIAGLAVAYWVLFHAMAIPDDGRLELWDILRTAGEGDVNPFQDDGNSPALFIAKNLIWMTVLGAAFVFSRSGNPAFRGVGVLMVAALLTWLLGGLYISYAPDSLKFPVLQGIAPTRAAAWPQNIAYVALLALGFRWVEARPDSRRIGLAALAFAALFIIGPGNIGLWSGLLVAAAAAVMVLHWCGRPRAFTRRLAGNPFGAHIEANWRLLFTQVLGVVVVVTYAIAIWGKSPAWKTTLETGVFGDATPAAWIGVAEYIRDNTPPTASVLPISYQMVRSYPALPETDGKRRLWVTRSLGTRAGRAMPVPEDFPGDFRNPDSWRRMYRQRMVVRRIEEALMKRDFDAAATTVAELTPAPGYIVLPADVLGSAGNAIGPYRLEHRIRGYAVLRRRQ